MRRRRVYDQTGLESPSTDAARTVHYEKVEHFKFGFVSFGSIMPLCHKPGVECLLSCEEPKVVYSTRLVQAYCRPGLSTVNLPSAPRRFNPSSSLHPYPFPCRPLLPLQLRRSPSSPYHPLCPRPSSTPCPLPAACSESYSR